MPDITLITSALNGINSAIDIVKTINNVGSSIEVATLRLELAELMNHLADSKGQLAEIKSILLEKDNTISLLEKKIKYIQSNEKPIIKDGLYKFENDEGLYCTACWDKHMEKIRTTIPNPLIQVYKCPSCGTHFS